jgi:hypothetical protein
MDFVSLSSPVAPAAGMLFGGAKDFYDHVPIGARP